LSPHGNFRHVSLYLNEMQIEKKEERISSYVLIIDLSFRYNRGSDCNINNVPMLKCASSLPLSGQKINLNKNGYKGSRPHHIEFLMLAGMTTEYSQIRLQKFRTIK
jgi:hypothetical protein